MLCSHKVTHRSRAERPSRAWRGQPHACAHPPAGSVLSGRGQVRCHGGHEVVLSACRCHRLKELSKVKVIYRLFSPQGQGFRPSPCCQRHAAPPHRHHHLPAETSAGWSASARRRDRLPDSISRRGLQLCTGIILLFLSLPHSPAAKPLFNTAETLTVEERCLSGVPAP